jgi:enoyl-CoA hydratase/carnithine racemase
MTVLSDYATISPCVACEREDGVLTVRLHRDGGPFVFDHQTHHDLGFIFAGIAGDRENRVVILTGTGDRFCTDFDYGGFAEVLNADVYSAWLGIRADGRRMLQSFLDIEVPVISAINGPAVTHSELPLLADVVLAADHTVFQDATHFIAGLPPADGMQIVWTTLLGLNRGRHFLLTGAYLDAAEALRTGVVGEVLPAAGLMPRANELAADWARKSMPTLYGTRAALAMEWRRLFNEQLLTGLTHEALAGVHYGGSSKAPEPPVVSLYPGSDS